MGSSQFCLDACDWLLILYIFLNLWASFIIVWERRWQLKEKSLFCKFNIPRFLWPNVWTFLGQRFSLRKKLVCVWREEFITLGLNLNKNRWFQIDREHCACNFYLSNAIKTVLPEFQNFRVAVVRTGKNLFSDGCQSRKTFSCLKMGRRTKEKRSLFLGWEGEGREKRQ